MRGRVPMRPVWLNALLAGLLALAAVVAPAQHGRAVLARAAAEAAQASPGHNGHSAPAEGHDRHLAAPACFACVIMAAPGLPALAFVHADRAACAVVVDPGGRALAPARGVAWAPHRARAPPSGFPA